MRPQIGLRVAKALSCTVEKRRAPPKKSAIFWGGPASSQHYLRGGSPEKNFDSFIVQLSALATLRPIWGRVGQGAFELCLPNIRKRHFLSDPCMFGYIY